VTPRHSSNAGRTPLISIITPSFHQARYLEETLRSVQAQDHPRVEHLVIDGGSTDGSVAILEAHADRLAFWCSEPDRGQSHAINKGFARARGDLINWLNSDDTYLPGALSRVAAAHARHPTHLIAAPVINQDEATGAEELVPQRGLTPEAMIRFWEERARWHQPGIFFPRAICPERTLLAQSLHYLMDLDLFHRLLSRADGVTYLDDPVVRFRIHPAAKTAAAPERLLLEAMRVARSHGAVVSKRDEVWMRRYVAFNLLQLAAAHLRARRLAGAGRCLGWTAQHCGREGVVALALGLRRQLSRRLTGVPRKGSNALYD